jgi:hypothetical protein
MGREVEPLLWPRLPCRATSARGIRSLTPSSHHRLNTGSTSAAAHHDVRVARTADRNRQDLCSLLVAHPVRIREDAHTMPSVGPRER